MADLANLVDGNGVQRERGPISESIKAFAELKEEPMKTLILKVEGKIKKGRSITKLFKYEGERPKPKPKPHIDPIVEQLSKEKDDLVYFCRYLIKSRDLRMIDYFQAFFNPDYSPKELPKLLKRATQNIVFPELSFVSYGSDSSLSDLVGFLGGTRSKVYTSPAGEHVTGDVTLRGVVISEEDIALFDKVRENIVNHDPVTPKKL